MSKYLTYIPHVVGIILTLCIICASVAVSYSIFDTCWNRVPTIESRLDALEGGSEHRHPMLREIPEDEELPYLLTVQIPGRRHTSGLCFVGTQKEILADAAEEKDIKLVAFKVDRRCLDDAFFKAKMDRWYEELTYYEEHN